MEVEYIAKLLEKVYEIKELDDGNPDELLQDFISALRERATVVVAD